MTTNLEASTHPDQPDERHPTSPVPDGHRVLHVIVPDRVFNHVKAQAALSGMPFKTYMEHYLLEAFPYNVPPPLSHQPDVPPPAPTNH